MNVLNLSILDGWWRGLRAWRERLGVGASEPGDDARDLEALYKRSSATCSPPGPTVRAGPHDDEHRDRGVLGARMCANTRTGCARPRLRLTAVGAPASVLSVEHTSAYASYSYPVRGVGAGVRG
jgi:hypothetical protein